MRWWIKSHAIDGQNQHGGLWCAGLCLWLLTVTGGMCLLASYTNQAGAAAHPPEHIVPVETETTRKYRLLMFAHPRCPCTQASVSELARLMARCMHDVETTVYFYCPVDAQDDWVAGHLWTSAAAIPGVRVQIDRNGELAKQYGSKTSGAVVLYDETGRLLFHGGITQGRGHEGDNLGKLTVLSIVKGEPTHVEHCPVFGCSVRSASTGNQK